MALTLREKVTTYIVVGFFAILMAFPFYWMLTTALKPLGDLLNVQNLPFWFHPGPTWANFQNLLDTNYPRWLANTAIVGVAVVAITLVIALPAGYALARLSGRVGGTLGIAIFLTYLVPPTLLFLPLSRVIAQFLHLSDRLWALVVVYPSFTIPFAIWLLMGFFKTIPQELEDAALVAVLFGLIFTATDMAVVYILTNGGPFNSTQVITTWAFQKGIQGGSLGEGAAVSLFLLPVLAVVTIAMLFFARRSEVA